MRTHSRKYFWFRAFLLIAFAGGCRTWTAQPSVAKAVSVTPQQGPVRVTKANDSTVILFDVAVSGDSLIGFTGTDSLTRLAIPVAEVKQLEKWELKRWARYVRNYYYFVFTVGGLAMAWALWGT
jgi:hypothetical protein